MYTLQSGQLENALRGGAGTDISAKEMVQSLANCAQPLEHRGPWANTKLPRDNSFHFPSFSPASPSPSFYFPFYNRVVNIPPWQHVPWNPVPYPDYPQWRPVPYPDWNGGQGAGAAGAGGAGGAAGDGGSGAQPAVRDHSVIVAGPVSAGPIYSTEVTAGTVHSENIVNTGDIANEGSITNQGSSDVYGPVNHHNTVTNHQTVVNKKQVTNEGPVYNNSVTHNNVVHNQLVHNHGDTHHHGDTFVKNIFIEEVIRWVGPMWAGDGSGDYKGPLYGIELDLLTDVVWDGTDLKKYFRTVTLVGKLADEQDEVILTGTTCDEEPA